jgi:hypothetical protein
LLQNCLEVGKFCLESAQQNLKNIKEILSMKEQNIYIADIAPPIAETESQLIFLNQSI